MIAFKYTKTDGAEYLSHLDLLRHIDRTLRRAGIPVRASEGFHPHPKIYMNNPLGLGIKSVAEYCAIDSSFSGDFKELFNACSPKGVKCLGFITTQQNPNYAYTIENCTYSAEGIQPFDLNEILNCGQLVVTDKRSRTVDIRERILRLENDGRKLIFTLSCGEKNLRPDLFCEILQDKFGGKAVNLTKISAHGKYTF